MEEKMRTTFDKHVLIWRTKTFKMSFMT